MVAFFAVLKQNSDGSLVAGIEHMPSVQSTALSRVLDAMLMRRLLFPTRPRAILLIAAPIPPPLMHFLLIVPAAAGSSSLAGARGRWGCVSPAPATNIPPQGIDGPPRAEISPQGQWFGQACGGYGGRPGGDAGKPRAYQAGER